MVWSFGLKEFMVFTSVIVSSPTYHISFEEQFALLLEIGSQTTPLSAALSI